MGQFYSLKSSDLNICFGLMFHARLVTPSGLTSIPAGLETPELIELRKQTAVEVTEEVMEGGETPALYEVLPEKTANVGGAMMGSQHVYEIGVSQVHTCTGFFFRIESICMPENRFLPTLLCPCFDFQTFVTQHARS